MVELREFTQSKARPLPVILLADVSGSMFAEGKIEALNEAVREMISSFAQEDDLRAEIHLAVITFGGTARLHTPLQPARDIRWTALSADGETPLGAALKLAADLIEDSNQIPSRASRPTVLLVSDGQPTGSWTDELTRLTQDGRAQKADRIALAIGADADEEMLRRFLADPEKRVFRAEDAGKIKSFFRFVTMSVTTRSRSANPNQVPQMGDPFSLENF